MTPRNTAEAQTATDIARALSPLSDAFASGLRKVYGVLESDGAVSASDKALFTAAAAATQYLPALSERWLGVARSSGLPVSSALGALLLIVLNRGESAGWEFTKAIRGAYGESSLPPPDPDVQDIATDSQRSLEYFQRHFGIIPDRQRLFSGVSPQAFQGYQLMHEAALKKNSLDHKTGELLLCTIIAAAYQPVLLEIHIRSALGVGATHPEAVEAVLAAIPVAGMTVWPSAATALMNTLPEAASLA